MIDLFMYILILIGIILLFTKKNSKIYNFVLIIIIIISFTFSVSSNDSYAYENTFNFISKGYDLEFINKLGFGLDYGYLLFMKSVSYISKDYIFFRFFSCFCSITIILLAIKKLNKDNYNNLLLYFLFPMAFDIFQIEYFLSYSIVTYALILLINNEKKNILKFIILIIISSLIHKATIVFLPFLFIRFNKSEISNIFKKVFVPVILLFLFINLFYRINIIELIINIFPFLKNFVGSYYIEKKLNILTIIMSCALFIFLFIFSYNIRKQNKQYEKLFFMNCLSLFILPMIFVSLDFERLLRPQLLINYTFLINDSNKQGTNKNKYIKIIIIFMIVFRFFVHIGYYISNNNDIINFIHTH